MTLFFYCPQQNSLPSLAPMSIHALKPANQQCCKVTYPLPYSNKRRFFIGFLQQ